MQTSGIRLWIVVAAWIAAASGSTAHANECLSDWGAAGEIVRREKLLTVQQLTQDEGTLLPGQIVKATLCKDGDDYVYKVVVRTAGGALKTIVVEARPPAADAIEPAKSR